MTEPAFDAEAWMDAMERLDADGVVAPFADEVDFHDPGIGRFTLRRDDLRNVMARSMPAIRDLHVDLQTHVQEGRDVALLARARLEFATDYEFGGVTMPVAGKTLDVVGALFATLDDEGRIRSATRIRDRWDILRQLGVSSERMDELIEGARRELQH